MTLLAMSQRYHKLPSEVLRVKDEYTAYCLDEACAFIMSKLDKGEEMVFETHYSSFKDIYSRYE